MSHCHLVPAREATQQRALALGYTVGRGGPLIRQTTDDNCSSGPAIPLSATMTGDVTFPPRKLEPPDDRPRAESGVAKPPQGIRDPCAPYSLIPVLSLEQCALPIRGSPAQRGRKAEESGGIAADCRRDTTCYHSRDRDPNEEDRRHGLEDSSCGLRLRPGAASSLCCGRYHRRRHGN